MPTQSPNAAQIRGALGLLHWENLDLAKACSISAQSVSNIKNGVTNPQPRILAAIKRVLEFNGIEFTGHSGVRIKPGEVEIYEGPDRFHDFTDYMYEYLLQYGGDVCLNAVDESLFHKYRRDVEGYRKRMKVLVDSGHVTFRIIASNFIENHAFAECRWQPNQMNADVAFYAFGNCLALISFSHDPAPYVVLHKSGPFAESYRQSFNAAWEIAEKYNGEKKKKSKAGNKR